MFTSVTWTEHVCVVFACVQSFARNVMCCVALRRVASRRVASRRVASRRVASRRVASRRVVCLVTCCVCHIKEIILCVFANNSNQATTRQEDRGYVNMSVSGNI